MTEQENITKNKCVFTTIMFMCYGLTSLFQQNNLLLVAFNLLNVKKNYDMERSCLARFQT